MRRIRVFDTVLKRWFWDDAPGLTILSVTKILNNDQILALPTTRVELVPAPGVGKALVLIGGMAILNLEEVYTLDPGADDPELAIGVIESGTPVSAYIGFGNMLTAFASKYFIPIVPQFSVGDSGDYSGVSYVEQRLDMENCSFHLRDDDNDFGDPYIGGDPANTLTLNVFYAVIDV